MGTQTKFCSNCGTQIDAKAEFCPKCGVRVAPAPIPVLMMERKSEGLAAILSFFIPGLGQIYDGQIGRGIIVFFLTGVIALTVFLVIGLILLPLYWIWNIYDAYEIARSINRRAL